MDDLEEITLFEGLESRDLVRIRELLRRQSFPAGTTIISAEQPGDAVYVIAEGTVKIFVGRPDGSEVVLAFLSAGDIVGEMSLVDSAGRSANVLTVEETVCLWMDRLAFLDCLRRIPRLGYNLFGLLSSRVRLANEQLQAMATLDVTGRVARQLLAFAEKYGRPADGGGSRIPLRLSQSDLAGIVGASRERVNHAMVYLRRAGHIEIGPNHRIIVRDRAALAERCLRSPSS
ncbi:MAG: Crp/Fnr family transcriptional regulator [bacterium]|nr:Crp/Fnr family transcriptional regulator [bacterium]